MLLIDGDVESNPGPSFNNECKLPRPLIKVNEFMNTDHAKVVCKSMKSDNVQATGLQQVMQHEINQRTSLII